MSIFNMAVPPHPDSPYILRMINWGQPDDPQKKYPLMGRLRYVWLSEDYKQVKLLLKDGPNSWSEEHEAIMKQIKGHESFVSVETWERDPVYVIATFNFLEKACDGEDIPKDMPDLMKKHDADMVAWSEFKLPSITKHPFDIFDDVLKQMEAGTYELPKEAKDLGKKIDEALKDENKGDIHIIKT